MPPPLNQGIKILLFRLRSLSVDVLFWFALFLAFLGNRVTKPFKANFRKAFAGRTDLVKIRQEFIC